jgi:hypothetical protein
MAPGEKTVVWRLDPAAAALYTRSHPRRVAPGCEHPLGRCRCDPPDYHRCEYVDEDGVRCGGPPGHVTPHQLPRGLPSTQEGKDGK